MENPWLCNGFVRFMRVYESLFSRQGVSNCRKLGIRFRGKCEWEAHLLQNNDKNENSMAVNFKKMRMLRDILSCSSSLSFFFFFLAFQPRIFLWWHHFNVKCAAHYPRGFVRISNFFSSFIKSFSPIEHLKSLPFVVVVPSPGCVNENGRKIERERNSILFIKRKWIFYESSAENFLFASLH